MSLTCVTDEEELGSERTSSNEHHIQVNLTVPQLLGATDDSLTQMTSLSSASEQ